MAEPGRAAIELDLAEATVLAQSEYFEPLEREAFAARLDGRLYQQTDGALAIADDAEFTLDRDDYELTVAAVRKLGAKDSRHHPIPWYEELAGSIGLETAAYLGQHVARGDRPELTLHRPFTKQVTVDRFLELFNGVAPKQGKVYPATIWDRLFRSYSLDEHNNGQTNMLAGLALNDTTDPADRRQAANSRDEPGLVYTGRNTPEQLAAFRKEQRAAAGIGVKLDPETVSQYFVLQTKRLLAGLPPLDQETFTSFLQYDDREIDGNNYQPGARWTGKLPGIYGSRIGDSSEGSGARRVIVLDTAQNPVRALH
jgi:hypothetical protein